MGHFIRSEWLLIMGQYEEAMAEAELAVELDPLSAGLNSELGYKLFLIGDYDRALDQAQKTLELDPNFRLAHVMLAQVYARKGMSEESLSTCEKAAALLVGSPFSRAYPSLILAMVGKTDEAKTILSELKGYPKLDHLSLFFLAETCSVMSQKDEAFEFLEAAYRERVSLLIFLGVTRTFDNIRADPRFADLLRRMGLPQVTLSTPS